MKTPGVDLDDAEVGVRLDKSEQEERTSRLKIAIKSAGGPKTVALNSGVPFGTINNYMLGREMRVTALTAIARACNVTLDWLATGRPSQPQPIVDPELGGAIDPVKLGSAIILANSAFAEAGRQQEPEQLGRIVTAIYQVLLDAEDPFTVARLMFEMIDRLRST